MPDLVTNHTNLCHWSYCSWGQSRIAQNYNAKCRKFVSEWVSDRQLIHSIKSQSYRAAWERQYSALIAMYTACFLFTHTATCCATYRDCFQLVICPSCEMSFWPVSISYSPSSVPFAVAFQHSTSAATIR